MVRWVVEAAEAAGVGERVLVATPDAEILDACRGFGAEAILTRMDHPSGTDRLAEVAAKVPADVYVNVQGDEPLVPPTTVRAVAEPFRDRPDLQMATVWAPCPEEEVENPAVVKVTTDLAGFALTFSRYAIPYPRNPRIAGVKKHIGLYAYTAEALARFATWEPTPLERTESLEQLRFLEHGVRIFCAQGEGSALAVDTPEQAEEVRRILELRSTAS